MSRGLARVIGTAVGLGLLSLWWANHGEEVHALVLSRLGWLLGGLIAATAAMILQWVRTAWLLRVERPTSLIPTVLLAHGLNVFLPSLLGDAYEVGAVSTLTGRPVSRVLTRLLHRFATTLGALGILAALALLGTSPNLGFVVLCGAIMGPIVIDAMTPRLGPLIKADPVPGLGLTPTLLHLGLAVLQHALSALALFCFGVAIASAVSPAVAAAMLSVADLMTYVPVPLAGVGLHHWSVSATAGLFGAIPADLVAFNHALMVLIGGICAGLGFAIRSPSGHNG